MVGAGLGVGMGAGATSGFVSAAGGGVGAVVLAPPLFVCGFSVVTGDAAGLVAVADGVEGGVVGVTATISDFTATELAVVSVTGVATATAVSLFVFSVCLQPRVDRRRSDVHPLMIFLIQPSSS
jgi:hypothetical protein